MSDREKYEDARVAIQDVTRFAMHAGFAVEEVVEEVMHAYDYWRSEDYPGIEGEE